ncbi:hypothetical protein GCM10010251_67490 [Streptomyces aurantiogriseus]|uniref:Uncharacterized protein n=1 Tax=Streptomyces aurantiogriseus TaxID=66870 RepID=A0A918FKA7_9ACTN|nr:hypothetical protein GCM10010251_67490 [Streptomyces aurantiogriseus]
MQDASSGFRGSAALLRGAAAGTERPQAGTRTPASSGRKPTFGYVTDWVAGRTRYRLTIDSAEQATLAQRLAACPDQPITVALAR